MNHIDKKFYERKTQIVARELLGKHLVHKVNGQELVVKIVETEAYTTNDPACHANRGITPRNKIMFGPGGFVYVYFTYGNHWLLNFVTGDEGKGEAVLIRAGEPVKGIEAMRKNRPGVSDINLTNGPGKLTKALAITKDFYGLSLNGSNLYVKNNSIETFEVVITTRIGIREGCEFPYRYYIKDNPYVSKK
jgi:DNA-3-methyladenine glycosylase